MKVIKHRIKNVSCITDEYEYIKEKLGFYQMHTQGLRDENGKMIDILMVIDSKGNEHWFKFCVDSFFYEKDIYKRIYGDKK